MTLARDSPRVRARRRDAAAAQFDPHDFALRVERDHRQILAVATPAIENQALEPGSAHRVVHHLQMVRIHPIGRRNGLRLQAPDVAEILCGVGGIVCEAWRAVLSRVAARAACAGQLFTEVETQAGAAVRASQVLQQGSVHRGLDADGPRVR